MTDINSPNTHLPEKTPKESETCDHRQEQCKIHFSGRDYISGETFSVASCGACRQIVTIPLPADLSRYYPAGYYGASTSRRFPALIEWFQNFNYTRRVKQVLKHTSGITPSVLDIGCGRGFLLHEFRQRNCVVLGTELSSDSSRFAREELKLPVRVGRLNDLALQPHSFDVVVLWHVLEHTSDPRETILEVSRLLRDGGVILIGVPNFASPESRLSRAAWFHLDLPRHLSHHTPNSLSEILAANGLRIIWRTSLAPEYDCFSFIQSVLNKIGLQHNLLYNMLRGVSAKVQTEDTSWLSIGVTLVLLPPLFILSIPITFLMALFGSGATMTVIAKKTRK